ncbi:MAG: branched-chain amino acid ABC transporter substrate-binding protein [Acidimicrobiia bacterium]
MTRSWSARASHALLVGLLAGGLLACGGGGGDDAGGPSTTGGTGEGDSNTEPKKVVALAMVGALTGENANLGINVQNGAQLAIEEADKAGELEVEVVVKPFDTQGDPAQAQTVKDQVVADEEVVGVIGPVFSGESKAANPTFEEAGLALITPSATNPDLAKQGWKVFHRLLANDDVQGSEAAKYLAQGLDAKNVAIVHDNTDYGKGIAEVVRRTLTELTVKVDLFEAIDPKATDYSAAVNKVRARKSPVVFYGGYYPQAGRLVKQLRDKQVTATFVSGDGSKDPGLLESSGPEAAEGMLITCPCADATVATDQPSKDFAEAYTKRFKQAPGTYSGEAYDTAKIFLEAIRADNTTRESILEFLSTELGTYRGITKEVTFQPDGEVTASAVYVYAFEAGALVIKGTTTELSSTEPE